MVLPLARSSAVEHYLDTVGVGGSRPPAPTKQRPHSGLFSCPKLGGLGPPRKFGGQVGPGGGPPVEGRRRSGPCPAGRKVRDRPRQPSKGRIAAFFLASNRAVSNLASG